MAKKPPRRIEYMSLDSVKGAKKNPKLHSIEDIKASYQRFSAQDSPVLDERTKRLLSGHGRIAALKALRDAGEKAPNGILVKKGEWLVPIQRGGRTKNDAEAKAYILAANKLVEKGGWDAPMLNEVLGELTDFSGIGFEMPTTEPDPPETTPDDGKDDVLPRGKRKSFKLGQKKKIGRHTIICADCVAAMKMMEDESVDAIVTDPPYGIGFMGKEWDVDVPGEEWARECLRVLKPGGHIIAFAATRTIHRLAVAIEDAGFEIRDTISWLYWQGFPKSLDVSKAIDRMKFNREETLEVTAWIARARDAAGIKNADIDESFGFVGMAGHWTSQKSQPSVPTLEQVPVLLKVLKVEDPPARIRKLLLDLNAQKGEPGPNWWKRAKVGKKVGVNTKKQRIAASTSAQGLAKSTKHEFDITAPSTEDAKRWDGFGTALKPAQEPAILARKPLSGTVAETVLEHGTGGLNIDGCRMAYGDPAWPGPGGEVQDMAGQRRGGSSGLGAQMSGQVITNSPSDLGRWPANIYVCPKPAGSEKNAGLDEYAEQTGGEATSRKDGSKGLDNPRAGAGRNGGAKNFHATVKPVRLMRWLIRLVTPPGGTVVDTFLGSGTTMVAAEREGFDCIGIEMDGEFAALSEARVRHALKG